MSRQVRTRGRTLAVLAVAVASMVGSCGGATAPSAPAGSPGSTPAVGNPPGSASSSAGSQSSEVDQLLAQAMSVPVDVSDPGPAIDRAEQGMKVYMRQSTGIAGLLGADGAAILADFDAAEREAVAALMATVRPQVDRPDGGAAALEVARQQAAPVAVRLASAVMDPARGGSERGLQDPLENLTGVFIATIGAPSSFAGLTRDASGNATPPPVTRDSTSPHGERSHFTMQPSLVGSRLSFETRGTISAGEPLPYTEETSGKVTVDLCPDANGDVALELSLGTTSAMLGGGMQFQVTATVTGHVDDSGKLASYDTQSDGSLATQPLAGSSALGVAPMYVEMSSGFSSSWDGSAAATHMTSSSRTSSRVDRPFAENAAGLISLGRLAAFMALISAQDRWTTGYCLEVSVPSMGSGASQTVAAGSTTPFTANVRHKFDQVDLTVPVTAVLGSGGVSVSPSGAQVPAPATFQYVAPDTDGQTATVNLETHSKRGIATLAAVFRTGPSSYTVDGTSFDVYHLTGTVCDLAKPFALAADAATIMAKGAFSFTPRDAGSGAWSYRGKMGAVLSYQGSGTYTVVTPAGAAGGTPVLRMTGGTDWTMTAPGLPPMPLGEGQHLGPGGDVTLVPTAACAG